MIVVLNDLLTKCDLSFLDINFLETMLLYRRLIIDYETRSGVFSYVTQESTAMTCWSLVDITVVPAMKIDSTWSPIVVTRSSPPETHY